MSRYIHLIGLWILALAMVGCQEEEDSALTDGTGLLISLTNDVEVTTKSTPKELGEPLKQKFKLKVVNDATPSLKYYEGNYKEGLKVPTPEGRFRLTAEYGTNPILALNDPYYKGDTIAEVEKGKTTSVSISCKVANALTSVVFGEPTEGQDFTADFSDYRVDVFVEEDENHTYVAPVEIKDNGKSAYYRAGTIPTFTFVGTVKGTGKPYTFKLENDKLKDAANFAAGKHCIITLTMAKAETGLKVEVSKVKVEKVDISETIPLDWLPRPKLETEGFDVDDATTLYMLEGATRKHTAKLNINLAKGYGLDELTFSVNGDTELEGEYKLSEMTEEQRTAFVKKGIVLPVIGDLNPAIDFSAATATATANEDGSDATLALSNVVATAYTRSNDALSYKLITTKIDPDLVVYPGNIWTKEFTPTPVCASGNESLFNKNVSFEYSKDGGNSWIASPKNEAITGLNPGETYKVRSVCLGLVSEAKEVKTYPQIVLENGDMEDWSSSTRRLIPGANFLTSVNVTAYSPKSNIWTCVNQKTFEGSPNISSTYNLNPSTYKDVGRDGKGNAAVLRTVGWDNAAGNTTSIIKHISAGKLFIGTYNFTHKEGPENYNYGMEYSSRPTALSAYFKYSPYSADSFKVWIVLENRDDDNNVKRIGFGELVNGENVNSYKEMSIPIVYNSNYKEYSITHMYVVFSSSSACSENESEETKNLKGKVSNGDYHNGSVLTIDDISLIYDK